MQRKRQTTLSRLLAKMGGSYLSSLSSLLPPLPHLFPLSSEVNLVSICFTPFLLPFLALSLSLSLSLFFHSLPMLSQRCFFLSRSRVKPSATTGACRRKRDLIVVPFSTPAVYTVHLSISVCSSRKNDWEEEEEEEEETAVRRPPPGARRASFLNLS